MSLLPNDEELRTERLVLRRITADDLEFYTRIHADEQVARYLSHGRPRSADESRLWFDAVMASARLNLGHLAVRRVSDGALLGRCGLSDMRVDASSEPPKAYWQGTLVPDHTETHLVWELGYTFAREHWGAGYAREAATAVLAYSKQRPDRARTVSLIHAENQRSARVASVLGAQLSGSMESFGRLFDCYEWR